MFRTLILGALLLMSCLNARGDILRLRNGTTLEGKFISGSEKGIWFERTPEGSTLYPLSFIERMTFGTYVPYSALNKNPKSETAKAKPPRTRESRREDRSTLRLPVNSFR